LTSPAPNRRPTHPTRIGILLFAFAFAVMADPVSSVAYAIEAALRSLGGRLDLLLVTMVVVLGIIAVVCANYDQLIRRFPAGGGAVAATGAAFGEGWAFLPLGALIVDFVLTIAISVAAASSAAIAYVPELAPHRTTIAVALCCLVAGLTWFGHIGRSVFAAMTVLFIGSAIVVVWLGWGAAPAAGGAPPPIAGAGGAWAVILAFPVAMALATGVEAPASAIAQLGQLDDRGRIRSGRLTLWLTFAITSSLTLLLAALAVRLGERASAHGTLLANVARAAAGGGGWFAAFQATSALLLLAAASSSFQAGPGLLKALSREAGAGVLPPALGRTNRHHTPTASVIVFLAMSVAVVIAARGREQELVLFYAVSVFISFVVGLLAMARFALREHRRWSLAMNAFGAATVAFVLAANMARGQPIASVAAALLICAALPRLWVRAGRPRGIAEVVAEAEQEDAT
jgi:hypothetical protein